MKRESKYIVVLVSFLVLFVLVQLIVPKSLDWTPTFLPSDKNPFGAWVTSDLLDSFFEGKPIHKNNLTFYELQDSIKPGENIISISNQFDPDKEAAKTLLNKVHAGAHAFISAYFFKGTFRDTLGLYTTDVYFSGLVNPDGIVNDTSDLKFVLPGVEKRGFYYRLENISYFFSTLDSIRADSYTISTNAWGKPVTMRIPFGKGYFIVNTTPLAFTNNYLLYENNAQYASTTWSVLPVAKTWWTSYYQVGRLEASSPMRFVFNTESLRWAYYVVISALLIFLLFESKRKQRIIPILRPLANTTLEFVKTIGNMYLFANDHKAIAEKRISYFLEQIRSNFYLSTETGEAMVESVAKKSGNSIEKTQKLFALIRVIQSAPQIPQTMLLDLNQQIESFKKTTY